MVNDPRIFLFICRIRESLNAFVCEFKSCLFSFRKQFKRDEGIALIPHLPPAEL
jgi:hypothetical protein